MAGNPPKLKVNLTASARRDLNHIWAYNYEKRGFERAVAYESFLIREIEKLESTYLDGREVPTAPKFQYVTARKSTRGHGHLVIYEVVENRVEILRLYHTRQDWENRFLEGR